MTVMLLAHEKVASAQEFSEGGFRGVLLPAGEGSVAVLTRKGQEFRTARGESQVLSEVALVAQYFTTRLCARRAWPAAPAAIRACLLRLDRAD